jgi:hypothetical protein
LFHIWYSPTIIWCNGYFEQVGSAPTSLANAGACPGAHLPELSQVPYIPPPKYRQCDYFFSMNDMNTDGYCAMALRAQLREGEVEFPSNQALTEITDDRLMEFVTSFRKAVPREIRNMV